MALPKWFMKNVGVWLNNNMEELRYQYDLKPEDLVIDLGGYKGEWSKRISDQYGCKIEIYEPINEFYQICNRLKSDKIKVFKLGAAEKSHSTKIFLGDDGSSAVEGKGKAEDCEMRDVKEIVSDRIVDLLKINIEGLEYEVLERLIECNAIGQINNIQVQFHPFDSVKNYNIRRDRIRKELSKTHVETYNIDFVWENWKRK
jgi:FkbM family methyltransferase